MTQENRSSRQAEIHITQMRRNPYLVDYQTGKNMGRHMGRRTERSQHSTPAMPQEGTRTRTYPQHSVAPRQENRTHQQKLRMRYMGKMYTKTIPTIPVPGTVWRGRRDSAAADGQESADISG